MDLGIAIESSSSGPADSEDSDDDNDDHDDDLDMLPNVKLSNLPNKLKPIDLLNNFTPKTVPDLQALSPEYVSGDAWVVVAGLHLYGLAVYVLFWAPI